jgi:4,5-DOPA dioxygenase extradiol
MHEPLSPRRMPAVFFGHGNPMNALARNGWTDAWTAVGMALPRPRAVLMVSAHWYVPGVRVTSMPAPRTIHDFGNFPRELFDVRYPAPGSPALAQRVAELISPTPVVHDDRWGLDHGTWSVLCHVYPDADIPVVQLSLDETLTPDEHYALARRLSPLRDEGVLIAASGNIVHNLHAYAWGRSTPHALDWAHRFDARARELIHAGDHAPLLAYESIGRDAQLSIPTPDHFLPLLYVLAQQTDGDAIEFPVEGFDGGSISMLSLRIG